MNIWQRFFGREALSQKKEDRSQIRTKMPPALMSDDEIRRELLETDIEFERELELRAELDKRAAEQTRRVKERQAEQESAARLLTKTSPDQSQEATRGEALAIQHSPNPEMARRTAIRREARLAEDGQVTLESALPKQREDIQRALNDDYWQGVKPVLSVAQQAAANAERRRRERQEELDPNPPSRGGPGFSR